VDTVPNRGTHNRESPFLSGDTWSKWHHEVISEGRAEKIQEKELQKIDRRISENVETDDREDLIMDALLNWETAETVQHVFGDMTKPIV